MFVQYSNNMKPQMPKEKLNFFIKQIKRYDLFICLLHNFHFILLENIKQSSIILTERILTMWIETDKKIILN